MTDGVWRTETGDGAVVVLVHGSMDRSTSFGRMVRHLGGSKVVRYDRRGYGRSLDLGPPRSIGQQADDLLEVIDGRRVRVFGHSLGGVVALVAAERAPDLFDRLVAYEAPRSWLRWWPTDSAGGTALAEGADVEQAAERFMVRMVGEEVWSRLGASTRAARRAEGATLVAELESLRPPNPPPYDDASLSCDVVSAYGSVTRERHRRAASDLAAGVGGSVLRVVDGAGHGVHLSHPAEAAALIVS